MSTKQEALRLVVEAIRTAGLKAFKLGHESSSTWMWLRKGIPEALHKMQGRLEAEQGGFEAASLIGCALTVYHKGLCSEKSWKIIRLELDDARKKLEAAIESELVKEVCDSVAHITGDKKAPEGLTLTGVLFSVAGDSKLTETQEELAKVRKELEALKAKKPDMGSFNGAWAMACTVCTVLNARLPTWNDNKGFNSAQNASTAIMQMVDEAMLNRAKASAWDRVREVLQETDDKWNAGPHDEPSNAESAIRFMAQKAKDGEDAREIWQLVFNALRQTPALATALPIKEAAPAAVKQLAEKASDWNTTEKALSEYFPGWGVNGGPGSARGWAARITLSILKDKQQTLEAKVEGAKKALNS